MKKSVVFCMALLTIVLLGTQEGQALVCQLVEHHVETIDDLMALSLNDLLNMDGIGSETLRLMVKKLSDLGIDYFPVMK